MKSLYKGSAAFFVEVSLYKWCGENTDQKLNANDSWAQQKMPVQMLKKTIVTLAILALCEVFFGNYLMSAQALPTRH